MKPEDRYDSLILFYAEVSWVDPTLIKRQLIQESSMNPTAVSRAGARGLGQFMRRTWEEWKDGTPGILPTTQHFDIENPEHNIRATCAYMRWLLDRTGSTEKALAAYNWGIGNVQRLVKYQGTQWRSRLPVETARYLDRILV